ncbi:hypothetical protein NQ314_008892 [Rhamnusium bicolor]|uniref:Uncharacterized protein n=1 Tax=Rhamnusium bicolor TaxID=1586634 RepID=A0AAV8Y669_9CUCU|nr:hypothetical protein NQ314_008892 [Rhamnusium bicolor]
MAITNLMCSTARFQNDKTVHLTEYIGLKQALAIILHHPVGNKQRSIKCIHILAFIIRTDY